MWELVELIGTPVTMPAWFLAAFTLVATSATLIAVGRRLRDDRDRPRKGGNPKNQDYRDGLDIGFVNGALFGIVLCLAAHTTASLGWDY